MNKRKRIPGGETWSKVKKFLDMHRGEYMTSMEIEKGIDYPAHLTARLHFFLEKGLLLRKKLPRGSNGRSVFCYQLKDQEKSEFHRLLEKFFEKKRPDPRLLEILEEMLASKKDELNTLEEEIFAIEQSYVLQQKLKEYMSMEDEVQFLRQQKQEKESKVEESISEPQLVSLFGLLARK